MAQCIEPDKLEHREYLSCYISLENFWQLEIDLEGGSPCCGWATCQIQFEMVQKKTKSRIAKGFLIAYLVRYCMEQKSSHYATETMGDHYLVAS